MVGVKSDYEGVVTTRPFWTGGGLRGRLIGGRHRIDIGIEDSPIVEEWAGSEPKETAHPLEEGRIERS